MHRLSARRGVAGISYGLCVALATLASQVAAQAPNDSARAPDSTARAATARPMPPAHRGAWKPALGLVVVTAALIPADKAIMREIRSPAHVRSKGWRTTMDFFDQVGGAGGVQIIGPALWGIGIVGRWPGPADIGLHMSEAFVVATAAHYVTRALVGRPRPTNIDAVRADEFHLRFDWRRNIDSRRESEEGSFPSGHSLTTFAMATMMHYEIGAWAPRIATPVRIAAWTIALGDGVSRVYRDNHWASDMAGAAVIGVVVGRTVVGYQHAHPRNAVDRVLRQITFTPAPNGALHVGAGLPW